MKSRTLSRVVALVVLLGACTTSQPEPTISPVVTEDSGTVDTVAGDEFDQFVDQSFLRLVARHPETATAYGVAEEIGVSDQLTDMSPGYADETRRTVEQVLDQLDGFEAGRLRSEQRLTAAVYRWHLEQMLEEHDFIYHDWPVHYLVTSYNNGLVGLFTEIHPLTNRNEIEDYLDRLDHVGEQVDQVIENLKTAVGLGIVPPRYVIDITVNQLRDQVRSSGNAITDSFASRVEALGLNRATVSDYNQRAGRGLSEIFIPAWNELAGYLESIRARADDTVSVDRLPDGQEFYRHLLRFHTSTDLSPEEIHQLGRREAERIREEMRGLGKRAGLDTDDIGVLRTEFAAAGGLVDPAEVVDVFTELIDRSTSVFEPYFSRTPTTPLQILSDRSPVSFYIGPALDGSRPGSFHAATGGDSVPRYTMKSLAHHEAVPGHHFQIALALESELPLIQRLATTTGHAEGWALYSERLASDIGLYDDDPAGDFGRLDYELLRAARLIVDTGIHHLGWSRPQAISEMESIMGGSEYNIEIDRYVVYPGQATAYMVGMLKILELRAAAGVDPANPQELADFHETIIGAGNLPLTVLGD